MKAAWWLLSIGGEPSWTERSLTTRCTSYSRSKSVCLRQKMKYSGARNVSVVGVFLSPPGERMKVRGLTVKNPIR